MVSIWKSTFDCFQQKKLQQIFFTYFTSFRDFIHDFHKIDIFVIAFPI